MMEASNGITSHLATEEQDAPRFSRVPAAFDLELTDDQGEVNAVELDLINLPDDTSELAALLENEKVPPRIWITVSQAYAKQDKWTQAVEILEKGLLAPSHTDRRQKGQLSMCLAWMYMHASRSLPRKAPGHSKQAQKGTKGYCLANASAAIKIATQNSTDPAQVSLAKGVLQILHNALEPVTRSNDSRGSDENQRMEPHRRSLKLFEDVGKSRGQFNVYVTLGKAKALFSLQRYNDALSEYQRVLRARPALLEPNPRIGIGCCLWSLGFKKEAAKAWERVLEMDPRSKVAYVLIAQYKLDSIAKLRPTERQFREVWQEAIKQYAQVSFKLDKDFPLANVIFGNYFLACKAMGNVDPVARRALERTDVNAIASDAWYILARRHHTQNELDAAADCYRKSDDAKGGSTGNLAAKLGSVQILLKRGDVDDAKFRLERIVQNVKCHEAMTMLGSIYAESALGLHSQSSKGDKGLEAKKAVALLEAVRLNWKDHKKNFEPEPEVLLNLTRLYELTAPEKAFSCLSEAERLEYRGAPGFEGREHLLTEEELQELRITQGSPQLLGNMACMQYSLKQFSSAVALFETALQRINQLQKLSEATSERSIVLQQALATTISYNLARTFEALGIRDKAKSGYQAIVAQHPDYIDAKIRLTCMALIDDPHATGPQAMNKLYSEDQANSLEVRALYGWFLSRRVRRSQTINVEQDQEYRHYKHTLQGHDKHDLYSLVGMGNIYLSSAREMPRISTQEKDRRHQQYDRAVDCFKKAISLDPNNAYAAQGVAIALVDDLAVRSMRDAAQIFGKVKEAFKNASVFANLGHVYTEMKQWPMAIEAYESALSMQDSPDPNTLVCLGRAWFLRAREEKQLLWWKNALTQSSRALERASHSIPYQFNVALCQFQIAQQILSMDKKVRQLTEMEEAMTGLNEAIQAFKNIARSKDSPYESGPMNQRSLMSSNTIRKKLETELEQQRAFEKSSADKLEAAKKRREEQQQKKQEEERQAREHEAMQRQRIAEERMRFHEEDAAISKKRAEAMEKERQEAFDSDGNPKPKRKTKRKELESDGDDEGEEEPDRRRRKRSRTAGSERNDSDEAPRVRRKPAPPRKKSQVSKNKFKSDEIVRDSSSEEDEAAGIPELNSSPSLSPAPDRDDEDEEEAPTAAGPVAVNGHSPQSLKRSRAIMDDEDSEGGEAGDSQPRARKRAARRIDDDEDEDGDDSTDQNGAEEAPPKTNGVAKVNGGPRSDSESEGEGEQGAMETSGSAHFHSTTVETQGDQDVTMGDVGMGDGGPAE